MMLKRCHVISDNNIYIYLNDHRKILVKIRIFDEVVELAVEQRRPEQNTADMCEYNHGTYGLAIYYHILNL